MAYNTALLTGLAFAGKLKSFSECFPGETKPGEAPKEGLRAEDAKMLGALFRLREQGVAMTVERVSLH